MVTKKAAPTPVPKTNISHKKAKEVTPTVIPHPTPDPIPPVLPGPEWVSHGPYPTQAAANLDAALIANGGAKTKVSGSADKWYVFELKFANFTGAIHTGA